MFLDYYKNIFLHNLRASFLALSVGFILLISILFYATSYYKSHCALEDGAIKAMLQDTQELSKNIDIQLRWKLTLLETLANRTIIKGKIGEKDASMEEKLHILNDEHQRLKEQGFKRFGILNTDGIAFFTSGKQLYLGDKEHFIQALKGKSSVSNVLISQYDNEPIFIFSTPIKDTRNEKIIGALFAASDAKELSKMISPISQGNSGYAFIVNKEGTVIAHKDFSKVHSLENLLISSSLELSRIVSNMIESKSAIDTFTEHNKEWFISYAPIKTTEWSIGVVVPHDEMDSKINSFSDSLFVAFTSIVLLTLVLAYILINLLTRKQLKLEEEKKAKDADLLITKNKYETTLSALPDLLFELGLDGTYYECHTPNENLLAVSFHKLIGQKVNDVLPHNTATICLNALLEANDIGFSRGKVIEIPSKQGPTWFELSIAKKPAQNDDDQPRFIVLSRDITDRKKTEDRNYYLANFDYLTGLVNRIQLENNFNYMIALAKRQQSSFAVLFLDLDQFKEVNDTHGHHVGDKLLIEASHRLKFLKREIDVIARLGGDEFVILLPNTSNIGAKEVAQKVVHLIAKPYTIGNETLEVSVSIGISLYPQDGETTEILSQKADKAMYQAKKSGGNTFVFFK